MSKPVKKHFLSLDLAERMIRVEQKVSAAFHKAVPYKDTEYYRSMSMAQQQDFDNFLKNKNKKKFSSFLVLIFPLLLIVLFSRKFTGNVIIEHLGFFYYNIVMISLLCLFFIVLIVLIFSFRHKLNKKEKFDRHVRVIDNIVFKKRLSR